MKVLVVTGDTSFKPGNPRFDLQKQAVDTLVSVYWGPGTTSPHIPDETFDVVTVQDPFWRGFFAWRVARRTGARFNVQLHADFKAQSLAKRLIGKFILKNADSIRVVSERLRKQVQSLGVIAPITVLPVFIDLQRFKEEQRMPDPSLILWVGRFEDEKDPLKAVEIFKSVLTKVPEAKLIMLGTGSLEDEVRKAAAGLSVEFPGWVDAVPYLARATAVLSTSRAESWGASIVEALAAGVPTVAPDVGVALEAGATVVPYGELANTVVSVLTEKPTAELKLPLLSEFEWIERWKQSFE